MLASIAILSLGLAHACIGHRREDDPAPDGAESGYRGCRSTACRTYRYETNFRPGIFQFRIPSWTSGSSTTTQMGKSVPTTKGAPARLVQNCSQKHCNWIVYFEYMGNLMSEGYWMM